MAKIRRAIVSVSDKTGMDAFVGHLVEMGVEIFSTGGTARALREHGIQPIDVSEYTGFPEMMDGRVKTLHPMIHGALLGRRSNAQDIREMERYGIKPIDMVVVNLYPFETTITQAGCTLEEAIENIDIGGPTMIRSAAKNYHDVSVIVDPDDYSDIVREMKQNQGHIAMGTNFRLAKKVFQWTARYDTAISTYLKSKGEEG